MYTLYKEIISHITSGRLLQGLAHCICGFVEQKPSHLGSRKAEEAVSLVALGVRGAISALGGVCNVGCEFTF